MQIIRIRRKQDAGRQSAAAAAAGGGGGGLGSGCVHKHSTSQLHAATLSTKRTFDDWVPQQHSSVQQQQQQQQQQHTTALQQQQQPAACPPRPFKPQKYAQTDTPAHLYQQPMPQVVYSKSAAASAAAAAPAASAAHASYTQGITQVPAASAGPAAAAAAAAAAGTGTKGTTIPGSAVTSGPGPSAGGPGVPGGPGVSAGGPGCCLSSDAGSLGRCSSGFSLGGTPIQLGSSTDDLAVLGFDWEHSHLPGHHLPGLEPVDDVLGATAAAAADAALASAGVGGGVGGGWPGGGGPAGEGVWGDGEEEGCLLVEGAGALQGQGLEATAWVL
jgi:hypothetical protein